MFFDVEVLTVVNPLLERRVSMRKLFFPLKIGLIAVFFLAVFAFLVAPTSATAAADNITVVLQTSGQKMVFTNIMWTGQTGAMTLTILPKITVTMTVLPEVLRNFPLKICYYSCNCQTIIQQTQQRAAYMSLQMKMPATRILFGLRSFPLKIC